MVSGVDSQMNIGQIGEAMQLPADCKTLLQRSYNLPVSLHVLYSVITMTTPPAAMTATAKAAAAAKATAIITKTTEKAALLVQLLMLIFKVLMFPFFRLR